jgi:L-arabinokinase
VPEGKGVSSSAALEVATMTAVAAAFDVDISPRQSALLCQRVENLIVGAPCGVMDQMTSVCGEENQLLEMRCQPAEVLGTIKLPRDIAVWGLDSGVRHSVGGGDYGSVRAGTFMGYRIIAELAGLNVIRNGKSVVIDDPYWNGYLANLAPVEFEERFAKKLPETIVGEEFIARYGGTTDPVTNVAPEQTYSILAPVAHAVYENSRVNSFAELLRERRDPLTWQDKATLGKLMYESHASYSACGLGSPATDTLVELVRTAGAEQGLYGAKITGGGSGGTVAVLGNRDASAAVGDIAQGFFELRGYQPYIFSGSSPGSAAFGHLVLKSV